MKTCTLFVFATLLVSRLAAADAIQPVVGTKFGEVMSLDVEFVDKQNSYFAQNIIKEPWLAKVLVVNGKKLEQPVVMEYLSGHDKFEKGRRYHVKAYTDIYSFGEPPDWDVMASQFNYAIYQRLVLKPQDNSTKQKKDG